MCWMVFPCWLTTQVTWISKTLTALTTELLRTSILSFWVFTSAEDDCEGFALLLGGGGGGFDAGVEAREIVAGASCGVV